MCLFPSKADLLSKLHAEDSRDALNNLDEYLEEVYKTTDSDNNGHINFQEFEKANKKNLSKVTRDEL